MNRLNIFICTLFPLLFSHSVLAMESRVINGSTGLPTFELRFFDIDDGPFMGNNKNASKSSWNLSQKQKDKVTASVNQWAQIIQPESKDLPVIINIGTFNDANAAGYSPSLSNKQDAITQLQAALQGKRTKAPLTFGSHAQFVMGLLDFDNEDDVPSQILDTKGVNLVSVAFHELAHGLGISSHISDMEGTATPQFHQSLNSWSQHLYDDNGNPAQPNQMVLCAQCETNYHPTAFDARKDQAYFDGKHVSEVLAGSLPGVPVKMLYDDDGTSLLDNNYMSHSELKNSMMSHQSYRNYATFMEAELAVLQDLNYTIDRRNFFGYSVYNDGLQLANTNGFFKRNDTGTDYLVGQYNPSTQGLGLHIYGSHNHITQQADLLSNGAGGAGIRVDGTGNTVSIDSNTRIYADGLNGRGILFAYGKEHHLIQRGDVQALGENGVAISFDFGNNLLSNQVNERGSYIHKKNGKSIHLLDELDGPLVNQFDLTGRVTGKSAAIYLSSNALVKNINIMQGAQIKGNIYSDYVQHDENSIPRLTHLIFGQLADETGRAKKQADNKFQIRYDDNIEGLNNLAVFVQGGHTTLNGQNQIYHLHIAPSATLAGNARYTINENATFVNEGTLAPGNDSFGRIDILGHYKQTRSGTLLMDIDGQAHHDTLAVGGHARLGGHLLLDAKPGWYAQNWKLLSNDLVKADIFSGKFDKISARLASPTLSLQTDTNNAGIYQMSISRQPNAYSQYALNTNDNAVGDALFQLSYVAQTEIQPLYGALDFSTINGSTVSSALRQLSPAHYSAMAASSIAREREISDLMMTSFPINDERSLGHQWQGFVIPFGKRALQKQKNTQAGYKVESYGLLLGAEKNGIINNDLTVGLYGAVSRQQITLDTPLHGNGHSTALNLGLHWRFMPDIQSGLYAMGNAQLGWEDNRLKRQLRINDYAAHYQSDWHAWSRSIVAGGGYRWALSDAISAGPVAQINYTTLARPAIKESGDSASFNMASLRIHALRSSLGLNTHVNLQTNKNTKLQSQLQVTWDREFLHKSLVQNTTFNGYSEVNFSSRNQLASRDSLNLQAGMSYDSNEKMTINANVSTPLFKSGYSAIAGNLSAKWRF